MPTLPTSATSTPVITALFETAVPAKRRSVLVPQGMASSAQVTLCDSNGDSWDLSNVTGANYTVGFAVRETLGRASENALFDVGSITTAASGLVALPLPAKIVNTPGIYVLEIVVTDDTVYRRCSSAGEIVTASAQYNATTYRISTQKTDLSIVNYDLPLGVSPVVTIGQTLVLRQQLVRDVTVLTASTLSLIVERGIHGTPDGNSEGPPTLAEVRLHLRDFPETNLLLDEYEFDEAEVALAAERVVLYFNELPPPTLMRFNTQNFPWRYHWLEGIAYLLYLTAAAWHRRNRLPYSAGGLTIDDTGKDKEYLAAAQLHERNFKEWAQRRKVGINMEEGFASFGSDYSYR